VTTVEKASSVVQDVASLAETMRLIADEAESRLKWANRDKQSESAARWSSVEALSKAVFDYLTQDGPGKESAARRLESWL
jgi:phosphopantetheinyl transferase (holo-ACP synthase)